MNDGVACFVNDIFQKAFQGSEAFSVAGISPVNQIGYDPLVPRRPAGLAEPVEIFINERNRSVPEESGPDEEGNNTETNSGDVQAEFTAARIRQMIDSREKIKAARENEREREVCYGDVAILLRTRARLTLLEEALAKYGVPYLVSAGIGFYSAQEIFDLTNYLTFLLDNSAEVALLTVLRSPFFGISDNELYSVRPGRRREFVRTILKFLENPRGGRSGSIRRVSSPGRDSACEASVDTRADKPCARADGVARRILAVPDGRSADCQSEEASRHRP